MSDHDHRPRDGGTDERRGATGAGDPPRPGAARQAQQAVPVGLERLLYLAAVDEAFRAELLQRREAAAATRNIELRPAEAAMLRSVPEAQLRATIANIDTSRTNLERRGFLRAVAASAVTIAAGEALLGCSDEDQDPPRPDRGPPGFDSGGIRPDFGPPPDRGPADGEADTLPAPDIPPAPAGIRPDGLLPPDGK